MKKNTTDTSLLPIEKQPRKIIQKGRKIKKWLWESLAGIIFFTALGLALLQWTFMHHSDDIFGAVLKEIVSIKSQEKYRLEYDSIRLDFLRGKMYVDNVRIIPDFTKIPSDKTILHIDIPKIELKIASLWRAYFQKEIKLYDIRFKQPFVEIFSSTVQKDTSNQLKIDNLYYFIENYAKKLEVNYFIISDGKFILRDNHQQKPPLLIQNIHVEVDGFIINQETNSPQRPFDANDFKFRISKNSIPLEKGNRLLYIGDLNIETTTQQLIIRDLRLDSLADKDNDISFKIPFIQLNNINFKKLHFEKVLNVEELLIEYPKVSVKTKKKNSKQETIVIKPYDLISKYLHEITIQKIFLKKGHIFLNITSKNSSFETQQSNIDISLFNFKLDSISQNERNKNFYIDDVEVKISKVSQQIRGNNFKGDLFISTLKSAVLIENLHWKTTNKQKEIYCKKFLIDNFNIWNFIHNKEFIASKIVAQKPQITFYSNSTKSEEQQLKSFEQMLLEIYPETSKFAKKIIINKFDIENALVNIYRENRNILSIDSLNVLLSQLNLSKKKFDRKKALFFAENLILNARKITALFPESSYSLVIHNFELNALDKRVKTSNLSYQPTDSSFKKVDNKNIYQISSKQLLIEGFKLSDILLDSVIYLDNFKLYSPFFLIQEKQNYTKKIDKIDTHKFNIFNIKKIHINSFLTENAQLGIRDEKDITKFNIKDCNILIRHLYFDSLEWQKRHIRLVYDEANLHGHELFYNLPDSNHYINIDFISYKSPKKSFYLKNLFISNHHTLKENLPVYFENKFSSVHLKGIDLLDIQKNTIFIDTVLLRQDFSKTLIISNLKNDFYEKENINFLDKLQQTVKTFPFYINVNHANIQLKNNEIYIPSKQTYSKIGSLMIELNHLKIDSTQQITKENIFFSQQNKILIKKLIYDDLNNKLSSEKIYFSLSDDSIQVENFSVKPSMNNIHHYFFEEKNKPVLSITNFSISKIGIYELLYNNAINIHTIKLEKPIIEIPLRNTPTRHPFSLDSLFSTFKNTLNDAKLNSLEIENGTLSLKRLDILDSSLLIPDIKVYRQEFKNLAISIKNWDIKDTVNFLNAKEIVLTSNKFIFPLPDSLNYLLSEKITFHLTKDQLQLDSLELLPRYSKAEYAIKSGKALDRFHLKTKNITIDNFNFKELFFQKKFNIGKIALYGLDLEVYGDKTVPETTLKQKYLLPTMLKNIPYTLRVDTVLLYRGKITYEEYTGDYEQKNTRDSLSIRNEGYISLQNINAIISGIANSNLEKRNKIVLQGQLQLMEKGGQVYLEIILPLLSEDEEHTVKAVVTKMPLKELNPILEKLAFIKIKDGHLKGLDLYFNANNRYAKGWMKMRYNDLKVAILNSKKLKGSSYKEDKFLSFFANNLFIRPHNPKNFFLKKGHIYHERDIHKSMVNFWVKAILSGVISSISPKKQKPSKLLKQEIARKNKILKINKNKAEIEIEED